MEIKFGDSKLIKDLQKKRVKNIETCKITIDLKSLTNIGIKKIQAIDLIKRLLKNKK